MISLIAAMAHQRVIGYQGGMPWHMPVDLKHFKQWTQGKTIMMGRKTFDSLGRPLPKRRNIVISRQTGLQLPGCEVYDDARSFLSAWPADQELMIIGGASLYEQAMPMADRMILTFIDAKCQGDTFFPAWDSDEWQMVDRDEHQADANNPHDYQFIVFERVR